MSFYDFDQLKEEISFEQAIQVLALDLKKSGNQWRGACPVCKGSERSLVITEGKGAFCFSSHKGGDIIWLTAHIRDCQIKDAAKFLADNALGQAAKPVANGQTGFAPLGYLEPEHEAVQALGFDVAFCKEHGIGYAPKGILRGTIAIPFRDEQGVLLGYVGIEDCKLPPSFMANVVPFEKKKA